MKFLFLGCLFSTLGFAQNIISVSATLVPNSGSFIATSHRAKGRLLKQGKVYTADRISIFVSSFKTENSLRDKHFSEYLGGGSKLPHGRIDFTELIAKDGKAQAKIKINGITKTITMKYKSFKGHIETEFKIKTSHFELPKAQYLGIGVEEEVDIFVKYYYEEK